jgi:GNAT superfamily N-acetyltransferase
MLSQAGVSEISKIEPGGRLEDEVTRCWMDVANNGGAVGFPFPPIDIETVREAVRRIADEIEHGELVVLQARVGDELAGWVSIRFNESPLTLHWATIERLQSHPSHRGAGVGAALLTHAVEHAASLGLEQLVLTVRGGENLEPFYERFGWHEIGRQVGALRFGERGDRDEVVMAITLVSDSLPQGQRGLPP